MSLVPSITETLVAWGIRPVAVTRFCEVPGLPTVGGTKNPNVESIISLRPDLVAMDAEENRVEDAAALTAAGITVHVTHVRSFFEVEPTLAGLWEGLGLVGRIRALGTGGRWCGTGGRPAARALGLGADMASAVDVDRG